MLGCIIGPIRCSPNLPEHKNLLRVLVKSRDSQVPPRLAESGLQRRGLRILLGGQGGDIPGLCEPVLGCKILPGGYQIRVYACQIVSQFLDRKYGQCSYRPSHSESSLIRADRTCFWVPRNIGGCVVTNSLVLV